MYQNQHHVNLNYRTVSIFAPFHISHRWTHNITISSPFQLSPEHQIQNTKLRTAWSLFRVGVVAEYSVLRGRCNTATVITIFILVNNQLDVQNLFYNKFISCLYMFRAPHAHRQEVKIVLYSLCITTPIGTVRGYQRLYNTVFNSWRWTHGARNM